MSELDAPKGKMVEACPSRYGPALLVDFATWGGVVMFFSFATSWYLCEKFPSAIVIPSYLVVSVVLMHLLTILVYLEKIPGIGRHVFDVRCLRIDDLEGGVIEQAQTGAKFVFVRPADSSGPGFGKAVLVILLPVALVLFNIFFVLHIQYIKTWFGL